MKFELTFRKNGERCGPHIEIEANHVSSLGYELIMALSLVNFETYRGKEIVLREMSDEEPQP